MALDFKGAALVAFARQQGMPMKSVLTLGRLDSMLTEDWLQKLSKTYGADVTGLDQKHAPHAEAFFKRLGAERVETLDNSAYQGCSIVHDLNEPLPRDQAREGYDLVYDGGTLEHVFHFPNAIANCMSLVKTGGHFMCSSPANQWLGHGFYQFSPELYFRVLSPENGFEIVRVFLAEFSDRDGKIHRVIDPAESGVRTLLDSPDEMLLLVWAKKTTDIAPYRSWPMQSDYAARWAACPEKNKSTQAKPDSLKSLRKIAGKFVPERIKASLAWKRHLVAANRGLVRMKNLQ